MAKKIQEDAPNKVSFGRVQLDVNENPGEFVPAGTKYSIDKSNEPLLEALAMGMKSNMPVLLIGPTGCGKTAGVRLIAEKTKSGYRRIQLTGATEVSDLIGRFTLKNQETVWVDGPLTDALRKGHSVVLDELNMALPEVLAKLNSVLDDDKMLVLDEKDGEVVHAHPNFRVFGTMNPSDEYTGTKDMNLALLDRFPIILNVDYPGKKQELEIINSHTGMKSDYGVGLTEGTTGIPERMVEMAIAIRKQHKEHQMMNSLSTRQLINWAKLTQEFGVKYAASISIVSKAEEEDRPKLTALIDQTFSKEEDIPESVLTEKVKTEAAKRKTLAEMQETMRKNKAEREKYKGGAVVDVEAKDVSETEIVDGDVTDATIDDGSVDVDF